MTTTRKVLAQHVPAAAATELMYTVPTGAQAVISSLICCNLSSLEDKATIAVVESGDSLASKNIIYYQLPIGGENTFVATIGITMNTGDMLYVYSLNGTTSFSAFGQEIT